MMFELAPSPQTTLESTVITGSIFEHVEQVGRPCLAGDGTGGFRGTLGNSEIDGRVRRLRLSGSSLLIFGSPLDEPLYVRPDAGVEAAVGVELPLPFLSDDINVDTDRVSLLGEG